jgi:hypothetical protein
MFSETTGVISAISCIVEEEIAMKDSGAKSIIGDLINFRGLVYSPINVSILTVNDHF